MCASLHIPAVAVGVLVLDAATLTFKRMWGAFGAANVATLLGAGPAGWIVGIAAGIALWQRGASNARYRHLGCAKTFALMGKAFAEANLKMISKP